MLAVLDPGTVVAGVLTRSKTCSAPVLWCRDSLQQGRARALVVNSGNANAFTGKKGRESTRMTAEAAAAPSAVASRRCSWPRPGVIGEPLDAGRFVASARRPREVGEGGRLRDGSARHHDHGHLPQARHPQHRDRRRARRHQRLLQGCRHDGARHGHHALLHLHRCGDLAAGAAGPACRPCGDDVQLHDGGRRHLDERHLLAVRHGRSGQARSAARRARRPIRACAAFGAALHDLLRDLAIQVAKDGEGASKFVTIEIAGAESWAAARTDRAGVRQLADPEGGHIRRGPQLGPRRHGGRQGRRGRRPRQALDLVRRHTSSPAMASAPPSTWRKRLRPT